MNTMFTGDYHLSVQACKKDEILKCHHCTNLHKPDGKVFSLLMAQQTHLVQLLRCYFCIVSLKTIASHCREGCWAVGWKQNSDAVSEESS